MEYVEARDAFLSESGIDPSVAKSSFTKDSRFARPIKQTQGSEEELSPEWVKFNKETQRIKKEGKGVSLSESLVYNPEKPFGEEKTKGVPDEKTLADNIFKGKGAPSASAAYKEWDENKKNMGALNTVYEESYGLDGIPRVGGKTKEGIGKWEWLAKGEPTLRKGFNEYLAQNRDDPVIASWIRENITSKRKKKYVLSDTDLEYLTGVKGFEDSLRDKDQEAEKPSTEGLYRGYNIMGPPIPFTKTLSKTHKKLIVQAYRDSLVDEERAEIIREPELFGEIHKEESFRPYAYIDPMSMNKGDIKDGLPNVEGIWGKESRLQVVMGMGTKIKAESFNEQMKSEVRSARDRFLEENKVAIKNLGAGYYVGKFKNSTPWRRAKSKKQADWEDIKESTELYDKFRVEMKNALSPYFRTNKNLAKEAATGVIGGEYNNIMRRTHNKDVKEVLKSEDNRILQGLITFSYNAGSTNFNEATKVKWALRSDNVTMSNGIKLTKDTPPKERAYQALVELSAGINSYARSADRRIIDGMLGSGASGKSYETIMNLDKGNLARRFVSLVTSSEGQAQLAAGVIRQGNENGGSTGFPHIIPERETDREDILRRLAKKIRRGLGKTAPRSKLWIEKAIDDGGTLDVFKKAMEEGDLDRRKDSKSGGIRWGTRNEAIKDWLTTQLKLDEVSENTNWDLLGVRSPHAPTLSDVAKKAGGSVKVIGKNVRYREAKRWLDYKGNLIQPMYGKITAGTEVIFIGKAKGQGPKGKDTWLQIMTSDGKHGWVKENVAGLRDKAKPVVKPKKDITHTIAAGQTYKMVADKFTKELNRKITVGMLREWNNQKSQKKDFWMSKKRWGQAGNVLRIKQQ